MSAAYHIRRPAHNDERDKPGRLSMYDGMPVIVEIEHDFGTALVRFAQLIHEEEWCDLHWSS